MLLKWKSSINMISQIWWYSKYESKKKIVNAFSYSTQQWQILAYFQI
jgi:hypothetical protein